jgi:hypothetical protein
MVAPLGGAGTIDPGAPTINAKKCRWWTPWEVPELLIRKRPLSMLRNIDDGALGGAGAVDPGAPTINAKKCRRWAPLGGAGAGYPGAHTIVTSSFKAKTRCLSYVCPGSSCHTYDQNVSTEN